MVTLRGERMWEFLDRLMNAALPRTRDFRGVPEPLVRRARQLHPRAARAVDLPRDQLRPDRQGARPGSHDRHHRAHRPGGAAPARAAGHAVPARRRKHARSTRPTPTGDADSARIRVIRSSIIAVLKGSPHRGAEPHTGGQHVAKKSLIVKATARRASKRSSTIAASSAAGRAPSFAASRCAASASASWRSRARFPGVTKASW